jgi:hypothetical protein
MCEEDTGFGETVVEGFSRELLEEFIVEFEKIHGMQSLWSDSQISRIQDSIEAYGRVNREKTHNNKQYIYST